MLWKDGLLATIKRLVFGADNAAIYEAFFNFMKLHFRSNSLVLRGSVSIFTGLGEFYCMCKKKVV